MPRLLDLFCCEGGAGWGYHLAGWDVVGVDCGRRDRYPFPMFRGDALAYLADHGREYDAVHASPPCQAYSSTRHTRAAPPPSLFDMADHPDLVGPTRDALIANGRPWIMENVPGAPMDSAVTLCGTMFALGARCRDGWRELRRHRLFESSHALTPPCRCRHGLYPVVGVFGDGGNTADGRRANGRRAAYHASPAEAVAALGVPWMSHYGATQAVPPAYAAWLGAQLLAAVSADA